MPARVWRSWALTRCGWECELPATLEHQLAVPQTFTYRVTMWPRNPTSRSVPKRKWKHMSTQKLEGLPTELCVTAKRKTQPDAHQLLNVLKNYVTCLYSGELLGHTKEWCAQVCYTLGGLANTMLNERSQSEKTTCYMILSIGNVQNRQI